MTGNSASHKVTLIPIPFVADAESRNTLLQGDHGGLTLSFVDWYVCPPGSVWAGENWAEMAGQMGKLAELPSEVTEM